LRSGKLIVFSALALALSLATLSLQAQSRYEPDWNSLDRRPMPVWYDHAKFGIFVVWGLYSVPSWSPKTEYAEWYWQRSLQPGNPVNDFHRRVYGERARYQDFARQFNAELFSPSDWAEIFARSGARYVVLTAQYHDGFCLWPSPHAWNWNSVDLGPHRDLVGELTEAVRLRGLRMGFYYSLYEWFHPDYRSDLPRFVSEHLHPQVKHLVENYRPSILWADGEWEQTSSTWQTPELLAWLFNESPVRDEVVVNDRWGKDTRGQHGGFYTLEYGGFTEAELGSQHKWEENRGMGHSYGYNRNESIDDYSSAAQLVHLLVDTVASGGNLLLCVGPTADGRIPVIMQERLAEIGRWLEVNGEAIFGTSPWRVAEDGPEIEHREAVQVITDNGWKTPRPRTRQVRYTEKNGVVFALTLGWPGDRLVLSEPVPAEGAEIRMIGEKGAVSWRQTSEGIEIKVPAVNPGLTLEGNVFVFTLTGFR
jgi:alpha-L-fucosidase